MASLLAVPLLAALLAAPPDLVFQSPDGDTLIVASPAPEIADESPELVQIAVLLRKGKPARSFRATDLLEPGELRIEGGRIAWLAERGSRTVRAGAQLKLASGRTLLVPFDGNLRRKGGPVRVAPPVCPCSYTDEAGTFHLVDSASEIPERYWSRAHVVDDTNLQVLPMPPPPPRPEPTPEPEPPPRAAEAPERPQQRRPPREDYYEYVRRITGQRGPQDRVNCIGNDGKPTPCDFLYPEGGRPGRR